MSDWTESAQSAACKIMTLLGHSQEPSNEPGDRLRDRVAVLVQQAIDARADTREAGLREAAKIARKYLHQAQAERQRVGSGHINEAIGRLTGAQIIVDMIKAAIPVREPPQSRQFDTAAVDAEWQTLLDKDDRTSPLEYPDMCLITKDELSGAMRAAPAPPQSGEREVEAHLDQERENIVKCIRSTTWSGSEEIVTMILNRRSSAALNAMRAREKPDV